VLYVGTCGYSYPDWVGTFYPPTTKQREMLRLYARRFPAVEIDATYYRIASPKTFETMARTTPEGFRFTAKLPGSLTHLAAPAEARLEDARYFRESIEPLIAFGKLGCVLMQFPHGFHPNRTTLAHIRRLRETLADLPLVAEFRNDRWQNSETLRFLAELEIGWCNVDQPQFQGLLRPSADTTSAIGYVRFHGRNARMWWKHEHRDERYDYLYSIEELEPWAGRVAELAADANVREVYAFFNNHRRGQAPRNAEQFAALLRSLAVGRIARAADEPPAEQLRLI